MTETKPTIKAILGLGNPGKQYYHNRHTIGFRIVNAVAEKYNAQWHKKENMEVAEVEINGNAVLLIKPQTFMNNSGQIIPYLSKQGINAENTLVVHDELELPFGDIKIKFSGSHKGHNGLKSIIQYLGSDFYRLRFGIGRPEDKDQVPDYVLQNFSKTEENKVDQLIAQAIALIEELIQ